MRIQIFCIKKRWFFCFSFFLLWSCVIFSEMPAWISATLICPSGKGRLELFCVFMYTCTHNPVLISLLSRTNKELEIFLLSLFFYLLLPIGAVCEQKTAMPIFFRWIFTLPSSPCPVLVWFRLLTTLWSLVLQGTSTAQSLSGLVLNCDSWLYKEIVFMYGIAYTAVFGLENVTRKFGVVLPWSCSITYNQTVCHFLQNIS